MSWATSYIASLLKGETVSFRPKGNSMQPRIESGQLCTVAPLGDVPPAVGEVVLCKVKGKQYLHLVTATKGAQWQISNAKNHVNGWVTRKSIYGRLISVSE
jgi:hypothetical protein